MYALGIPILLLTLTVKAGDLPIFFQDEGKILSKNTGTLISEALESHERLTGERIRLIVSLSDKLNPENSLHAWIDEWPTVRPGHLVIAVSSDNKQARLAMDIGMSVVLADLPKSFRLQPTVSDGLRKLIFNILSELDSPVLKNSELKNQLSADGISSASSSGWGYLAIAGLLFLIGIGIFISSLESIYGSEGLHRFQPLDKLRSWKLKRDVGGSAYGGW